jgi:acyl-CoA thioesterase
VVFDPRWFDHACAGDGAAVIPRWLCLGAPGAKHLSGGATTALLASRAARTCDKPLTAINVQFLAPLPSAAAMILSDTLVRGGRSFAYVDTQLTVGAVVAARAQAICGGRGGLTQMLAVPPPVPSPADCPAMPWVRCDDSDLHAGLDIRLAESPAASADGSGRYWFGVPAGLDPLCALAIAADYLPEMLHLRLGRRVGAISLDNHLRVANLAVADWLLCDVVIETVANGLFVGRIRIFNDAGILLASGGQTGLVIPIDAD